MKKAFIVVAILLVLGIGYYFLNQPKPANAPVDNSQNTQTQTQEQTSTTPQTTQNKTSTSSGTGVEVKVQTPAGQGTFSAGDGGNMGPDIQVVEVVFDGASFSPSTVNIKVNDYVIFKNKSDKNFWPASAPHPSHTNYPAFDAKKPIAPGGQFQFQFTQVGSWGFHDHLTPSARGMVNVTK